METYMDVLKRKTVKELRPLCKANGIKGYSKWKKQKLIEELARIESIDLTLSTTIPDTERPKTNKELKQLCKTKGIKGYSKWNKQKLIDELARLEESYRKSNDLTLSTTIPGTQTLINPQPGTSQDQTQSNNTDVTTTKPITFKELRQICVNRCIKGYGQWNKQKLIEELTRLGFITDMHTLRESSLSQNQISNNIPTPAPRNNVTIPAPRNNVPINDLTESDGRLRIESLKEKYIKKYATYQLSYKIKLVDLKHIEADIQKMIDIIKNVTNFKKGDKFQLTLDCPNLSNPISDNINEETTASQIIDYFHRALLYEEEFDLDVTIFNAQVTNMPRGYGGGTKNVNLAEDLRTKKSITQIRNKDNLCGPRAIIVALTYQKDPMIFKKLGLYDHELTYNNVCDIRKGRNIQKLLAENLCKKLYDVTFKEDNQLDNVQDVPLENIIAMYNAEGFASEDIINVETLLDIQIKIICLDNGNSLIYRGPDKDITIYLYKHGNHYDVINSMSGFYSSSYFCTVCDKPYEHKGKHACKVKKATTCHDCFGPLHVNEEPILTYCRKCNIDYCYESCFDNHIIKNVCDYKKRCGICEELYYPTKQEHKCGYSECRNCQEYVITKEHKCYIRRTLQKGGLCSCDNCKKCKKGSCKGCIYCKRCSYTEKYIFFDYEAMQDTGTHIPNLIVAQYFDGQKFIFKNNDDFCKWLINKEHRGYTCIAHNTKAYDTHFILQYCVENGEEPFTIYNGSKIMQLVIKKLSIKIIDSVSFVQGPLSNFPKTFGLTELKKGYFPHYFNRPENQDYIGTLPDIKYYSPNTMKKEARNTFLKWHAEKIKDNYVFDFQKDLLAYCESDVDILRRGCIKMRKNFLEFGNLDPFRYITIAGVCMAIFRSKYLKDNTIGVINKEQKDCYSEISISWLNSFKNNNIKHALNGGEEIICGAKVDGYDKETNTIYQFHGCFWHGCKKCNTPDKINHVTKTHYRYLYAKTTMRTEILRRHGYTVVEMWECNWLKQYKKREKPNVIEDLNPRNSFLVVEQMLQN